MVLELPVCRLECKLQTRPLSIVHLRRGHDEHVQDAVDAELLEDVDSPSVRAEVLEEPLELGELFRHALHAELRLGWPLLKIPTAVSEVNRGTLLQQVKKVLAISKVTYFVSNNNLNKIDYFPNFQHLFGLLAPPCSASPCNCKRSPRE